jgi:putative aminopeptidase FrvX
MISKQNNSATIRSIGPQQIRLLEKLCRACAVSGDEGEVRAIVMEQIRSLADEVRVDSLGNILAIRKGSGKNRLRVMMAAHMDEVGFMLTQEEDKEAGFFRFELVGGIDLRILAGKPVLIGKQHIPGVIGAKPVHLSTAEERKRDFTLEDLRIDVGPGNNKKVKIGDRATFSSQFVRQGGSLRTKALDDRLGVATLIELLKHVPAHIELLAAFTVQEEVGLRGAQVAAYALDPQMAIVLDSTPARDLPVWEADNRAIQDNTIYNTHLGAGPAIYIADGDTLSDPRLVRHLIDTAESLGIPYQIRQPGGGGTDAGAIHLQRSGVPSVSLSVPGRYMHTANNLIQVSDWDHTYRLAKAALERLQPELLISER